MGWDWLRVVAGIGVALQGYFAYKETIGWGAPFVTSAAPAWVEHLPAAQLPPQTIAAITWATPLAFNMGIYNLVLAIGLLWVAVAGASVAASLGIFLGVWLLMAAAAALWTQVYLAFVAQGLLGLAVLLLSIRSVQVVDETSPPRARPA
jgi:uncharacterized membrane protein